MNRKKVAIAACTGLDQPLGTVARMAAYQVLDVLRPNSTVLLCPPALIAEVEEDVVFIQENPVLVIDGCSEGCCERIVRDRGGKIASIVNAQEIQLRSNNLQPKSRRILGIQGEKLVNLVAKQAAVEVNRIVDQEEVER
ncbi:MAG: putative zinc-binding protein [Candidatus Bathyarchaeota archaeon]|nr:putative zinc-binding protein [Candidatus Bathyarchaeota archaeon]